MELLKDKSIKMSRDFMEISLELSKTMNNRSLFTGKNKLMKILMISLNSHSYAKMIALKTKKMGS